MRFEGKKRENKLFCLAQFWKMSKSVSNVEVNHMSKCALMTCLKLFFQVSDWVATARILLSLHGRQGRFG